VDPIHRVSVTDPDNIVSDLLSFTLTQNPGNLFQVDANGQISLVASDTLNFEDTSLGTAVGSGRAYSLQITATSSGTGVVTQAGLSVIAESATRTFNVFVVDINEAPYFVTSNAAAFEVIETWPVGQALDHVQIMALDPDNADLLLKGAAAPIQTLVFSAVAMPGDPTDGAGFFSVSTNPTNGSLARIVVKKALDFETAPNCSGTPCYRLKVRATDSGNPAGVVDVIYQFDLVNVNEPPVFSSQTFTVTTAENLDYEDQVTLSSSTPATLQATDSDAGGNAALTYAVTGGDGFAQFGISSLGAGAGFAVFKKPNILLDFESKSVYSLRVIVTDTGGVSSSIGKACSLSQGVSVGCNDGAVCEDARCHEKCVDYTSAALNVSAAAVPKVGTFFCQDLSLTGYTPVTPLFRETELVTVRVTLTDADDPPYFVDRLVSVPQPNYVDNLVCSVRSAVQYNQILNEDQSAVRQLVVWDDDMPNPGVRSAPFTFAESAGGDIWAHFNLNTSTGEVVFPKCLSGCAQYFSGRTFEGTVQVLDQAGFSSICGITANLTENNIAPYLGADVIVAGVLERVAFTIDAGAVGEGNENNTGTNTDLVSLIVLAGKTNLELVGIDSDTAIGDILTFSTSFSQFFTVRTSDMQISMKEELNYEDSSPTFSKRLLISVTDTRGESDIFQVTIPIIDVNEAPYWMGLALSNTGIYATTIPENTEGVLIDLTAHVTDPDIYASNATWQSTTISLITGAGCGASCPFELAGNVLQIKSGEILNFEADNHWTFVLRVTDGAGLYSDLPSSISLSDVNEPPVFTGAASANISEGNGGLSGTDLLDMAEFVFDPDVADPSSALIFNISDGNTDNVFEIRAGILRIAPNKVLD
jgi:hypothetical protein